MSKQQIIKLTKSLLSPHVYYHDKELGLYVGIGSSSDIIETSLPCAYDEFISIIDGSIKIQNDQTHKMKTVTKGNSFIIPHSYSYQCLPQHDFKKYFVIYKPRLTTDSSVALIKKHVVAIDKDSTPPWQETSDGFAKKMQYQSHNQKFTAGVWQGNDFKTGIINFPYNEFILIKQGCLVCTDEQGEKNKINVGEALFVPQGVSCAWQVQGKVSLHFVQIKP